MTPAPVAARPAVWPVLVAYVVAFFAAFVASTAMVLAVGLRSSGGDSSKLEAATRRFAVSAPGLLGSASLTAVVLVVVALVTARLGGKDVVARLRLGPTRASPIGLVAAVLGFGGLSVAGSQAVDLLGIGGGGVMETMSAALRSSDPAREALAILALGVAPGLAEEGFFRGLLQRRITAGWGRWAGVLVSAAAFGLFHVDPVQGAVAFVAGLYLAGLADRFGGIRPTIAVHTLNNAVFVLSATQASDEAASRTQTVVLLVVGVVVCAVSIVVLRTRVAVRG